MLIIDSQVNIYPMTSIDDIPQIIHQTHRTHCVTNCAPVDYPHATNLMEERVQNIHKGTSPNLIWFLEHPPLYTGGSSAKPQDLLLPNAFPVYETGRGGQYTYHGPGQLVGYCMINLKEIGIDVRRYVKTLEHWILAVLDMYELKGALHDDRIGVWVTHPKTGLEKKIAAIGVRVTHGITWHGFSFNRAPNLEHFKGIVPCGLSQFDVTSLRDLGIETSFESLICAFKDTIPELF